MEMAQFIAITRASEAEKDEEEYWKTHPWTRLKRDAKEYYNRKFRAEHLYKVAGADRLTAEERERLELEEGVDDQADQVIDVLS